MEDHIKKAMIEANELGLQGIRITGCVHSWTMNDGEQILFITDVCGSKSDKIDPQKGL